MNPIRVLVADDHPFFRDGLRVLLEATPDTELAGEAASGDEAVALARKSSADVTLMDLRMPGMGGAEATRTILQTNPDAAVLVVTMIEEDDSVFAAMRAGARGYLLQGRGQGRDARRHPGGSPRRGRLRVRYRPTPEPLLLRRAAGLQG